MNNCPTMIKSCLFHIRWIISKVDLVLVRKSNKAQQTIQWIAHGAQTRLANKMNSLVSVRAQSRRFVVLCAVVVGAVIEITISFLHRTSSSLIVEMPFETCERPMVCAFVLQEQGALLDPEFFQIPVTHSWIIGLFIHNINLLTSNG